MTANPDGLRESSRMRPGETTLSELDLNYLDATRVFVAYSDTGEYAERPVYARMGFEQVVGYARYVPGDVSAGV